MINRCDMDIENIKKDPKQIHLMIQMLQNMLEDNNKTDEKNISKNDWNKFDHMAENNMHKDDNAIDQKLNIHPITPRTRKTKMVTVSCRICGKSSSVPSSCIISIDRYKCNRCAKVGG